MMKFLRFGRVGHHVGLGEVTHALAAELAGDARLGEAAEGARSSTAVALWLLKKVTPVRS